jgi:hypothetical protein
MKVSAITTAAAMASLFLATFASASPSERALLTDWAVSRCVARAARAQPFAADAKRSAAALLERGNSGIETYARIDAALEDYTRQAAIGGSSGGTYAMLQCLEFGRSPVLAAVLGTIPRSRKHSLHR